jgi:hypothetical protein
MLEIEPVGRFLFYLESRRKKVSKTKLQNRRLSFKVVTAEGGRDLALRVEDGRWMPIGTTPASRVVGSVGSFVPRNSRRRARIVSKSRKRWQRRKLWA